MLLQSFKIKLSFVKDCLQQYYYSLGAAYHKAQVQEMLLLLGAHGMVYAVEESLTGTRLKDVAHHEGVHEIPTQMGIMERIGTLPILR